MAQPRFNYINWENYGWKYKLSKITINMDAERECDMNMYALRKKRNLN